jgi:Cu-Zn family superoxide dismutase
MSLIHTTQRMLKLESLIFLELFVFSFLLFLFVPVKAAHFKKADKIIVSMYQTIKSGKGAYVGTVTIKKRHHGVKLIPNLFGLSPGFHGFHVHQNPSCENNGLAAGGHYDYRHTNSHRGPYANGHAGDLPRLYVSHNGRAKRFVIAPRLSFNKIKNKSLMIHLGGDNYSDIPKKLGGGGARFACGVIKK